MHGIIYGIIYGVIYGKIDGKIDVVVICSKYSASQKNWNKSLSSLKRWRKNMEYFDEREKPLALYSGIHVLGTKATTECLQCILLQRFRF